MEKIRVSGKPLSFEETAAVYKISKRDQAVILKTVERVRAGLPYTPLINLVERTKNARLASRTRSSDRAA